MVKLATLSATCKSCPRRASTIGKNCQSSLQTDGFFVWMVAGRIGRGEELNLKFLTLFLLQVIYIVGQKRGEEWLPDPVAASDVG